MNGGPEEATPSGDTFTPDDAVRWIDTYESPHDAATTHYVAERIWDGEWPADHQFSIGD